MGIGQLLVTMFVYLTLHQLGTETTHLRRLLHSLYARQIPPPRQHRTRIFVIDANSSVYAVIATTPLLPFLMGAGALLFGVRIGHNLGWIGLSEKRLFHHVIAGRPKIA